MNRGKKSTRGPLWCASHRQAKARAHLAPPVSLDQCMHFCPRNVESPASRPHTFVVCPIQHSRHFPRPKLTTSVGNTMMKAPVQTITFVSGVEARVPLRTYSHPTASLRCEQATSMTQQAIRYLQEGMLVSFSPPTQERDAWAARVS